jgi:hypothetical protein
MGENCIFYSDYILQYLKSNKKMQLQITIPVK